MRVTNSSIIDQTRLSESNSSVSSADQAGKQQRIQQAKDSYNKNSSSAQVINAEYVEWGGMCNYSTVSTAIERMKKNTG